MNHEIKIDNEEYNQLLKNYENSSLKICIEKCCDYKFIFFLNNESTLIDLYNYVTNFYSHVTDPLLLYVDKNHKTLIPYNNIVIKNYLRYHNILSSTNLNVPSVYKFYLDLCSKHNNNTLL